MPAVLWGVEEVDGGEGASSRQLAREKLMALPAVFSRITAALLSTSRISRMYEPYPHDRNKEIQL